MYVLAPETLHEAWLLISRANHEKRKIAKLYHHIYHTWLCNSARWLQSMADECKHWSERSVLCVVCVMGRSDTGPAEYQDSRDRCSDKCCHNHIGSRSRDVVVRLLVGDNQLHGWHLCKTTQIFMHIFQQKCANFGVVCIPSPGAGGSDASSNLYLDKNWKFDLSRRAHSQVSGV